MDWTRSIVTQGEGDCDASAWIWETKLGIPLFTKLRRLQGCLRATFLLGMDLLSRGERGLGRFSNSPDMVSLLAVLIL